MNPLVDLVSTAYHQADAQSQTLFRLWVESTFQNKVCSLAREELMRQRVLEYPVTTESLEIAKNLRLEGFYTTATKLCDIARRVEKIRSSPHRR